MSSETVQAPTVGRIVHFHGVVEGTYEAAIVTAVRDGMKVDLTIFANNGFRFAQNVDFDSSYLRPGTWSWPARR